MANYRDIERICKKYKVKISKWSMNDNSVLMALTDTMFISQDWIDADYNDDNLFEMLVTAGQCVTQNAYGDDLLIASVNWAIERAKELGLKISRERQSMVEGRLTGRVYNFDFEEISDEISLKQMVDKYGLPVKVTMPRYWGNFYYVAEKLDKKRHMIDGTQYKNGEVYRSKSYSYSEICKKYDDGSEPAVEETKDESSEDRAYNNSIKKRIQDHDAFDEVEVNNPDLLNHQKAGCLLASRYNKFAFFYDTGTGKTVMTLSIIKEKQQKEDAHFLILAPKAIIKTAWMDDSKDFFPDLRILPISNNFYFDDCRPIYERWRKYTKIPKKYAISDADWEKAYEELDFEDPKWYQKEQLRTHIWECMLELADHYIVNIEKFRYDPDAIVDNYVFNGVIVDESAILKNPESKSAQTLFEYADDWDYIYLLSGKPAPNNSTEYYAQMKLVDPNTFYMSFGMFKRLYFSGSGSKIAPISAKAEDDVANMIAVRSLIVSKDDCLTLPEMFQEIRTFKLPLKIMEQYDRLYKFCIFELQANEKNQKGAYYSAVCKLAIFTKLREIASGFLIDEYQDVVSLHNLKSRELIKIVEEHPDDQIIVWCQFEYEIKEAEKALEKYGKVVTAYGKTQNIDESISMFKNGEAKYIIAHPKSIKYGVTFIKCNIAVYYAMSYSAEDYYQSRDRIYRLGQKNICTYYFIQAENTIDEIMYEAVDKKMSYAEIFSIIVKQAAKHGINYQEFKNTDELPVKDELISTQTVKAKYYFEMVDDIQFTYKVKKQTKEAVLYNTLLKEAEVLRPEEILFEIGYALKLEELEKQSEKDKKEVVINYNDVIEVAKWVISEMKELNIKRIQKVYDYLEEQIQKQYERDVANGGKELKNLDVLALIKPRRERKRDEKAGEEKKKFRFGQIGKGKKSPRTLMGIRKEVDEVFFDSGKYRLTHQCFCGDDSVAHCHLGLGLIYQSKSDYENITPETLFDLLHEIGHLESNTDGMTRQEEEFFATQWALERMKLYDFQLPKKRQKEFDEYINGYSSRRNKILTSKNATNLDWDE